MLLILLNYRPTRYTLRALSFLVSLYKRRNWRAKGFTKRRQAIREAWTVAWIATDLKFYQPMRWRVH